MCKIFYTYEVTLEILALQIRISDLVSRALSFLEQYDCETVGKVRCYVPEAALTVDLVSRNKVTRKQRSVT